MQASCATAPPHVMLLRNSSLKAPVGTRFVVPKGTLHVQAPRVTGGADMASNLRGVPQEPMAGPDDAEASARQLMAAITRGAVQEG